MDGSLLSDTEIYKNTYHELVLWVKELLEIRRQDETVYDRNILQARRIMELEFDLSQARKYIYIMNDEVQETAMKEYGVAESNVVSNDELKTLRLRRKAGGGNPPVGDWLSSMVWGTEFCVRPKIQKTWLLAPFMMAGVRNGMVWIIPMKGDQPDQDDAHWMWVDPKLFCEYWEWMGNLHVPEKIDE